MTRRVALVGNPNVGKSTIFNSLTGLHQHTGNWAGVTVACTEGTFKAGDDVFSIVDLPGIYSFDVRSAEEAVTRDYVEGGDYDCLLLVCDATCLERGLFLLGQAEELIPGCKKSACSRQECCMCLKCPGCRADEAAECSDDRTEMVGESPRIILCVNLCDEAERKGIHIDFSHLEDSLGIPVVPCCGKTRSGIRALLAALSDTELRAAELSQKSMSFSPSELAAKAVIHTRAASHVKESQIDRILTGRFSGTVLMIALLFFVLWLTITGANYPSELLWKLLFKLESALASLAGKLGAPQWSINAFIYGMYRVVAWIVSVMLPPMAIFFPLFTILEDLGYLPRVAFNMDGAFEKCRACGKQCLTMAMGLGCNAAGVVGCRIIDSPRERLIAILTNSLVPCNGRFPLLLTMISLFMLGMGNVPVPGGISGPASSMLSRTLLTTVTPALLLTAFILAGVLATLAISKLLSCTLLKGVPSSFILELPPYRRPQVGKVIVRSVFDRTLFVLGRAVAVAAPAGLLIWVLANITVGGTSLLLLFSGILDPLGRFMGLDGTILMAFILGFPANEIVLPIILMAYLQSGVLVPMDDKAALAALLYANGWTYRTVLCMSVFTLFHWPCSTTCLTIKKETGSLKWTAVSFLIPTITGFLLCVIAAHI